MKAQSGMETALVAAIVLAAFALTAGLAISRQNEVQSLQDGADRKASCHKIANEVSSVFTAGNGTTSYIKLEYEVQVVNDVANITGVVCSLCCNTTKNGQKSFNLSAGWLRIENRKGDIAVG